MADMSLLDPQYQGLYGAFRKRLMEQELPEAQKRLGARAGSLFSSPVTQAAQGRLLADTMGQLGTKGAELQAAQAEAAQGQANILQGQNFQRDLQGEQNRYNEYLANKEYAEQRKLARSMNRNATRNAVIGGIGSIASAVVPPLAFPKLFSKIYG